MSEDVIVAVMIAGTAGLLLSWRSQARDHERWARWLRERVWRRATAWAAALTAAAVVGALLAGSDRLAGGFAVLGGLVVLVLGMLWSKAFTFGPRD